MSQVTTHVLDTATGGPAPGVTVVLEQDLGDPPAVATAVTDADGRVGDLGPDALEPGIYRLRFHTGAYFAARSILRAPCGGSKQRSSGASSFISAAR